MEYPLARTGVPGQDVLTQVMPWAVHLLRFPAGGLSCLSLMSEKQTSNVSANKNEATKHQRTGVQDTHAVKLFHY